MQDVLEHLVSMIKALEICVSRKLHFAIYRLPGSACITLVVQKDPVLHVLNNLNEKLPENGFLIAPFSQEADKVYLIRPEMVIRNQPTDDQLARLMDMPAVTEGFTENDLLVDTEKDEYLRNIEFSLKRIQAGEFDKVVLSRVKSVSGNYAAHLSDVFRILCNSYNNAFIYLFYANGQCWTGATPEPFICSRGKDLFTVSLAGTRTYCETDLEIKNWNHKEILEQEYVTLHIEKILQNYSSLSYLKKGPYVARAGNLLHLRTDFTFSIQAIGNRLPSLINALHPTPAVCGMSTGKALNFISQVEKHNREYYTGFLGPVGVDGLLQLYVNLRCLKVYDNRVILFVGGGITSDSVAEEEWEETEIKAETLLSVLKQIK